ncbi:MAG: glycoside hydrolase family 25 protein [Weeksellaceae bacterium]|nr:glycoside hydrolase family 25 protein [Weeksellaceae bacterium]
MAKTNQRRKRNIHQKRRNTFLKKRYILLTVLCLSLLGTGFYLRQKLNYYFSYYFDKPFEQKNISNTKKETVRIDKIVGQYANQTFGFDLSHYQRKEDIQWDSLSIGNRTIPMTFVVLRASMGNRKLDANFDHFWQTAKQHHLIRGAYHYYRPDEDPVMQANSYLSVAKLESGDLPPILDIEKDPRKKSKEQLVSDLKVWLKIMEETYGEKPIIYTYYHYYKDYLKGEFDDYPLWLANYNDVPMPSPDDEFQFWQFSENGIVYGINTKVDLDVYNGNLWSLKMLTID